MMLIKAAVIGLTRALVPPEAGPQAGTTVPMTATTNLGLEDELRRWSDRTLEAQQHVRGLHPSRQAPLRDADPTPRLDRPNRIMREEAIVPAGWDAREVQLIQAIYRDQALFSPEARAAFGR